MNTGAVIVFILAVSLIANWFVQLSYYFYQKRRDSNAFHSQRTLLNYYTGYVGDGMILPVLNVLIFLLLASISFKPGAFLIISSLAIGLIADIFTHYLQGKKALTNWSMPKPFEWNFVGYWHMVSFPVQIGYISLFLITFFLRFHQIIKNPASILFVLGAFGLMVLFLVLFIIDYSPGKVKMLRD